MILVPQSLLYLFFILVTIPIFIKQFGLWMYLWQLKEYRGDKMWDYLGLSESQKIVFDKWTVIRFVYIIIFLIFILISNFYWDPILADLYYSLTSIFILLWTLESFELFIKLILRKKLLFPKISSKAALHSLLTITSISSLLYTFSSINISLNIFLFILVILLIPLIIGYWLLVLFPVDSSFKNKLFQNAKKHRLGLKDLKVIAVSGAYGKTTTKDILDQLLGLQKKVIKTLKNQNSNVSCARKTLSLSQDQDVFICELGSYKLGDGNEICDFIRPNAAIITGLNYQHYSLFGSEKNIVTAESESLKFLNDDDPVAINWSSQLCRKIKIPKNLKVIRYGVLNSKKETQEFDIYAHSIKFDGQSVEFILNCYDKEVELKTNLLSLGNIENIVGAIALSLEFGVNIKKIKTELTKLVPPHGALHVTNQDWGGIIDDSYNANYDGVRNALQLLGDIKRVKQNKPVTIALVDDILELGEKSEQIHRKVGEDLSQNNIDYTIMLGRNFSKYIYSSLIQEEYDTSKIWFWNEKNTTEIKNQIKKIKAENEEVIILFEGYQSRKFID
jgi:UDP-N-acetylmuramoyl-tripeptide--D-alanyl-D-alanine ligase